LKLATLPLIQVGWPSKARRRSYRCEAFWRPHHEAWKRFKWREIRFRFACYGNQQFPEAHNKFPALSCRKFAVNYLNCTMNLSRFVNKNGKYQVIACSFPC